MNFVCYIPVGGDLPLTRRAITSFQKDCVEGGHSGGIVLINNTEKSLPPEISSGCTVRDMPVRLLHGQSINWMIRDSLKSHQTFCMSLHNDAMLYPGAITELLNEYEEIVANNLKWSTITLGHHNGDAFVLWNPQFFLQENVWHQPFLHPFYYLDNTMYRMMELRGWPIYHTEHDLVLHEGSHTIKNDPVQRRINDVCFKHHGNIYREIWGGPPDHEMISDPTLGGIYPLPNKIE